MGGGFVMGAYPPSFMVPHNLFTCEEMEFTLKCLYTTRMGSRGIPIS